ncbi:MAG: amidophosphoribosyltransferase [Candidatus Magasanikbacteria bacterium CG10_big_fil_rev_8_21_14_0_10_47_10]|uniref:Amidophosphoribosyltransferase n=1 Tax=Candidatus Magasanikbacteria bacterium CG10_big_fil_rev_8_21_14_0_10_47_10 TaxID=1974652 RepID=A0A2H0TPS0_9BACT|nr:MAG: amidophosphoribosyltransferase [Candidatus Magasanikbacteria bacterium CG10_big_fil_rev_8_21_14_0_10_47_10]
MCGIIGIYSHKPVATEIYDGMIHLQHRGTDAAGILTCENGRFHVKKGSGLVRDIFHPGNMTRLQGNWGLGHNRYSTTGDSSDIENAQPRYANSPYGIAMVHNGNLTNYYDLKKELAEVDRYNSNTDSDIETLVSIFASRLNSLPRHTPIFEAICAAVESVFDRAKGGYSVIGIIAGQGMFAFRDPHGIRPLVYGARHNEDGTHDYIFSSENTMYYPLGFRLRDDIGPGEVMLIDTQGNRFRRTLRRDTFTPCIFEYVYLARPDAVMNNISVYRARLRMGQNLARKWKREHPDILPDVVVPVPFSSNTAALSMAHELGVRYTEGLYKNAYVGRTFIMPGQEKRRKSVLQKLSPQETELRGKVVMLLDDSIVRGTTSKEVVRLVRDAGAEKVYFVSACPEVKYPDFYGIDIPTQSELIASKLSVEEIEKFIEADILMYQDIDDLVEAILRRRDHGIDRLSMPCLDGWYVTGDIDVEKMEEIERQRTVERASA